MKVKKTININADVKGQKIIVYDLPTLQLIMGTTAIGGALHMYKGLKKVGSHWELTKQTLKDRIPEIRRQIQRLESKIELMEQFL